MAVSPLVLAALLALAILQALDVWSTKRIIATGGWEANPLMARLIDRFGFAGLAAVKFAMTAAAAIMVLAWPSLWMALPAALVLQLWVVIGNLQELDIL